MSITLTVYFVALQLLGVAALQAANQWNLW
jgi:hypothetical protein